MRLIVFSGFGEKDALHNLCIRCHGDMRGGPEDSREDLHELLSLQTNDPRVAEM